MRSGHGSKILYIHSHKIHNNEQAADFKDDIQHVTVFLLGNDLITC